MAAAGTAGELTALLISSSWIKGSLLLREWDGKGGEKRGGRAKGEKRRGGDGKGREKEEGEGKVEIEGPHFMDLRYAPEQDV